MTDINRGGWLLVALAVVGLAVAAPAVSAHGDDPAQVNETATDRAPGGSNATAWTAWMGSHPSGDHAAHYDEHDDHAPHHDDHARHHDEHDGHDDHTPHRDDHDDHTPHRDGHGASGTHGQGHGC